MKTKNMAITSAHPEIHDQRVHAVMGAWNAAFGYDEVTVSDMLSSGVKAEPALQRALQAVASDGTGFISANKLSKWLVANAGRVIDGTLFQRAPTTRNGVALWKLAGHQLAEAQ